MPLMTIISADLCLNDNDGAAREPFHRNRFDHRSKYFVIPAEAGIQAFRVRR